VAMRRCALAEKPSGAAPNHIGGLALLPGK